MNEFLTALITGIVTFTATNIDDIVILTLLFTQVNRVFQVWHIVVGQYLGFTVLVLISLLGFWCGLMIPTSLIRLFGLIPLGIGLLCLLKNEAEESDKSEINFSKPQFKKTGLFWSILTVAAITIANGGDNLGIYIPLFANSNLQSLLIILSVFMTLVGIWCYVAYRLTHWPAIAQLVTNYSHSFVPSILIGLGVFIVKENIGLAILALGISYFWLIVLGQVQPKNTASNN